MDSRAPGILTARVIVNDHREQARSYRVVGQNQDRGAYANTSARIW